jgi:hypothetical protein
MPSRQPDKSAAASRDPLIGWIASLMALGLLAAFWMLCSHQVHKAEVRDASAKVERMAVADCLGSIPGATLSSCAASVASGRVAGAATVAHDKATSSAGAIHARMSTAVPVNFAYR